MSKSTMIKTEKCEGEEGGEEFSLWPVLLTFLSISLVLLCMGFTAGVLYSNWSTGEYRYEIAPEAQFLG